MSNNKNFPFWGTDWLGNQPDWLNSQKQFLDAWSSFGQFLPDSSPTSFSPMNDAMTSWWQTVSPSLSGQNKDFFGKMMQQGKAFYFMGEQFTRVLDGLEQANKASEEWKDTLNDQFDAMKSMLEQLQSNAMEALQGAFTTSPFMMADTQQQDYFKVFEMLSAADKYSSIPGLGSNRESHEQMQEGLRLLSEYQQVSHEFNIVMNKVSVEALEAMRLMIIEMTEHDEEINSLREVYNLWVECNEKAYAEYIYTDEYSELYGELSNALMALKQHCGKVMDQMLAKLNMPTRKGMNTMLKRQQEMKRAQKNSAGRIKALESEISNLREMIVDRGKPTAGVGRKQTTASKNKSQGKISRKTAKKKAGKKASRKTAAKKTARRKTIVIDI